MEVILLFTVVSYYRMLQSIVCIIHDNLGISRCMLSGHLFSLGSFQTLITMALHLLLLLGCSRNQEQDLKDSAIKNYGTKNLKLFHYGFEADLT